MSQPRRAAWTAVVAVALVGAPGLGWAQGTKPKGPARTGGEPPQRASGVIVKVEEVAKEASSGAGKAPARTRRLTINTAAVWRDYARDQAPETRAHHNKADAAKGAESVATEGEPRSEDSLEVVEIGPGSSLEIRFRASDDETSAGASTPDGAVAEEKEATAKTNPKPSRAQPSELRKGLFVEADYRHGAAGNLATRVVIIKPIGGPNTPDSDPGAKRRKVVKD